jgi:hypothetical protein
MIVGELPRFDGEFHIECAYAGCPGRTKAMQVDVNVGPFHRRVSFAGITAPRFEDPPLTAAFGADLPPESILRVRWDRLTFYGEDPVLGSISIELDTARSLGRVRSLGTPGARTFANWINAEKRPGGTFFPAINENRLYFTVNVPRFGVTARNDIPVVNGAVINAIPPQGEEYRLQQPVTFRSTRRLLPLSVTLQNCQMAMSVLQAISLEVVELRKISDNVTQLRVRATNGSTADSIRLGVVAHSSCNIQVSPTPAFVGVGRDPVNIDLTLDLSTASPPGVVLIGFVLVEPYESPGANQLTIDYDEIRLGRIESGVPVLTGNGLRPSHLSEL